MTPEKRADIAERYGWQEGEREALQREMAERAARIKRDEALAWCKARNEARAREAKTMATDYPCDGAGNPLRGHAKSYDAPRGQPVADESYWENWRSFILRTARVELNASTKMIAEETGTVLGEQCNALRDEIASERDGRQKLEAELQALKTEIAELRGELKTRSALDEMTARLDRIEQARTPLKAIGTALRA